MGRRRSTAAESAVSKCGEATEWKSDYYMCVCVCLCMRARVWKQMVRKGCTLVQAATEYARGRWLGVGRPIPTFRTMERAFNPSHTHTRSAWRDSLRRRRPRARTPSEAPPAQHHATLPVRRQPRSLLDAVQSAVAAANHHCCNNAFHYTTQHTSVPRKRMRRANTSASARESPRGAFRCSRPQYSAFCSA